MNTNQLYNKTISIKNIIEEPNKFDLKYLTYHGKLTAIADYFNKLSIDKIKKVVNQDCEDKSPLDIAAFLGFNNIFLYLLTFNADPYKIDEKGQNALHGIFYKGEIKTLSTLLNFERFMRKLQCLENIDNLKKSYGFSKLDIVKGKLSRAVNLTEVNLRRFTDFQESLKEECNNLINIIISKLEFALMQRDIEGRTPLHYAAMSKYPLCYLIVQNMLDYDFFALDGWNEFLVIFQDLQYIEVKEERRCDPRKSLRLERDLINLLGEGIIKQLISKIKKAKCELLKNVINTADNMGNTVLHVAAFHGDFRIVNKLLSYGADKTALNSEEKIPVDLAKDNFVRKVLTSLNKAAKSSDEKNVTELIYFGHNINDKQTIFSQAPIHKIIESEKEDKHHVLLKMLDMGADPNIKDSNGWTALHYSCEYGDMLSAKILVENKSIVDFFSNNHRTPLHLSSSNNFPEIVKFLLDNGANPNFKDNNGCTPLHLAAKHGNIVCMDILLYNGALLYEEDFRKWNILHYAAFHGHQKAVRYLAKYDADYDILQTSRNSQNKLAIEIVRDPNIKPYFISLWHAAKEGNLDIIRQLLNDGENLNEQSVFLKNTPGLLAVLNNHYLAVRLFLTNGGNFNLENKDGLTAIEYAELINSALSKYTEKSEDFMNEYIDLRDFVRNVINKSEKILNSLISKENYKVKLWNMNDFSQKIVRLFREGK
jgi:ankyrin repeat protein